MANYDVVGNIAIVKFPGEMKQKEKREIAEEFLKQHKSVRTILEKSGKFKGRLRKQRTKWTAGEKTKEAIYRENDCVFGLNVESCYFSPRLSTERKEIALKVEKGEEVLVMFGGVAPFAIVIGKLGKSKKIFSIELSKECNKYAKENVKRNKLSNVYVVQGDVRKVASKIKDKFDRIIMARPNLEDSFLDVAFKVIKKKGVIHYYGFYKEEEKEKLRELILREAQRAKKKIKFLKIKKAGEVGVKKYRYRADFKVD
ncbi:methyltransferase domain-containing protein [Candidatus Pacearchaeota archaeon]|nr:methyltransferase domain-containing protein [Candidatus Pacearchaeota archaeon]